MAALSCPPLPSRADLKARALFLQKFAQVAPGSLEFLHSDAIAGKIAAWAEATFGRGMHAEPNFLVPICFSAASPWRWSQNLVHGRRDRLKPDQRVRVAAKLAVRQWLKRYPKLSRAAWVKDAVIFTACVCRLGPKYRPSVSYPRNRFYLPGAQLSVFTSHLTGLYNDVMDPPEFAQQMRDEFERQLREFLQHHPRSAIATKERQQSARYTAEWAAGKSYGQVSGLQDGIQKAIQRFRAEIGL